MKVSNKIKTVVFIAFKSDSSINLKSGVINVNLIFILIDVLKNG